MVLALFALEEVFGLRQRAADEEDEGNDGAADEQRDPPAPGGHVRAGDILVEQGAEGGGEDHRHLLAARLPRGEEALVAWSGDLRQVHGNPAQLDAGGKALQQPAEQDQERRHDSEDRVAGDHGDGERAHGHQRKRQDEPLAAPVMVDVGAQHERAQGPHEKAGAEGGERGHQRGEFALAGEELRGDGLGVVAVHHEVVHLEEVAAGDADDGADLGFAFL